VGYGDSIEGTRNHPWRGLRSERRGIVRSEVNSVPRLQAVVNTMAVGACALVVVAACGGHGHTASPPTTAASTTVVVTTTTIPPVTYTVKRGDTLSGIAKQFGGTIADLVAANHIVDVNTLVQGQVLVIPTPPTTAPSTTSTSLVAPTTTTVVVSGGPAALVVSPAHAEVGNVFDIRVTGAKPSESVTFEIDSPDGRKFTGQPHTAAADGSVTASYLTTQSNGAGLYTIIASGSKGTTVRSTFRVDPTA
jgi:LysM repeat protein